MRFRTALVGVIMLTLAAWFFRPTAAGPAAQAQPPRAEAELRFKTIADILNEPIDVKDFSNLMTFKEFFALLSGKLAAKGQDVPIMVDWRAFNGENPDTYPDPESLYNLQLKPLVREEQRHLKLRSALLLRQALREIPTHNATYLIRRGQVEIIPFALTDPAYLLGLRVTARFDKRPLDEALDELSHQTGATIVLDSRLAEKTKTPVTATFKGTVALETAVRLLAEMADLEAELEDSILFVTAKPKIETPPQKSELHLKNRWLDLALKDLARWSGATIVLDPNVKVRKTLIEAPRPRRLEGAELEVALVAGNPLKVPRLEEGEEVANFKITASFKPNVSIEAAVRIVANQAGLSVVVMDGAFFVTTRSNAEVLRDEIGPPKK